MFKPSKLFIEMVESLTNEQEERLRQKLDISKTTYWRRVKDPAAMRLDKAIKLCQALAIENPRDLVEPLNTQKND